MMSGSCVKKNRVIRCVHGVMCSVEKHSSAVNELCEVACNVECGTDAVLWCYTNMHGNDTRKNYEL